MIAVYMNRWNIFENRNIMLFKHCTTHEVADKIESELQTDVNMYTKKQHVLNNNKWMNNKKYYKLYQRKYSINIQEKHKL